MKRTVNLREMSAASSGNTPPLQESQTRKIMLDLQQEKKRLRMLQNSSSTPPVTNNAKPSFSTPNQLNNSEINMSQRNALQIAHTTSFGYFIPQASSFGNIILPVIPRLTPNK